MFLVGRSCKGSEGVPPIVSCDDATSMDGDYMLNLVPSCSLESLSSCDRDIPGLGYLLFI